MDDYEKTSTPCIIMGAAQKWPALTNLKFSKILERFSDSVFNIGDNENLKTTATLRQFMEYMLYNRDDSPLILK